MIQEKKMGITSSMRTGVRFVGTEANFYAVIIALKFFILTATCPRLKMDFPSELKNNYLIKIIKDLIL